MVARVSPAQVSRRLSEDPQGVLLLDVRENEEREVALIEPSLHIPMGEVGDRLAELPKDKDIVVYCHHGGRSEMVAMYLSGEGFPRVANLTGGIDAWSVHIDPKVPRYS